MRFNGLNQISHKIDYIRTHCPRVENSVKLGLMLGDPKKIRKRKKQIQVEKTRFSCDYLDG
jgi:hypothetical protein